ncbi:hypothetical protein MCOR26_010749, partial [Pyricularia oryzae]
MPPVTFWILNKRREKDCVSIITERKYFRVGNIWIKRNLRPAEWQIHPVNGNIIVPLFGKERLQNEAATLQYIAKNTNIPIPKLIGSFEDDGAVYLITEHVEGVQMNKLDQDQRKKVEKEVEFHLQTFKKLCSAKWGGLS